MRRYHLREGVSPAASAAAIDQYRSAAATCKADEGGALDLFADNVQRLADQWIDIFDKEVNEVGVLLRCISINSPIALASKAFLPEHS